MENGFDVLKRNKIYYIISIVMLSLCAVFCIFSVVMSAIFNLGSTVLILSIVLLALFLTALPFLIKIIVNGLRLVNSETKRLKKLEVEEIIVNKSGENGI